MIEPVQNRAKNIKKSFNPILHGIDACDARKHKRIFSVLVLSIIQYWTFTTACALFCAIRIFIHKVISLNSKSEMVFLKIEVTHRNFFTGSQQERCVICYLVYCEKNLMSATRTVNNETRPRSNLFSTKCKYNVFRLVPLASLRINLN